MSTKITFAAFVLSLIILASSGVSAQELYWHTQDTYSVELDGEGDAFVLATMTFEGIQENTNITEVSLEIPGRNIRVYKVLQTPYYRYGYPVEEKIHTGTEFLDYELTPLSASTQMVFYLKTPITPNQQTTVTIIYQTQDIATQTYQGLEFEFETIKDTSATIRNSGANVFVPQDMILKGKPEMETQYLPSTLASSSQMMAADEFSRQVSSYYRRISYQYTAKNLDPSESFTVTGLYGKSYFMLFFWEYVGTIVVIIVILLLAKYFGLVARIKDLFIHKPGKAAPHKAPHVEKGVQQKPVQAKPAEPLEFPFSIGRPLIMGMVTAFLYLVVSFLTNIIFNLIGSGFSPYSNPFFIPLMILMFLVMFALPILALFGPSIYVYKKYGWKEGLLTFVFGLVFTIVLLFAILSVNAL
jgi:hypothetical protein